LKAKPLADDPAQLAPHELEEKSALPAGDGVAVVADVVGDLAHDARVEAVVGRVESGFVGEDARQPGKFGRDLGSVSSHEMGPS
jgi:hypothetical protein